MPKIKMDNPIVEIDGDEMTRIIWQGVKEHLLTPFVDLQTEYYDLSLKNRDRTEDRITVEAAEKIKEHKVAVKCATITPNAQRVEEYNLQQMWKSPNGTIRAVLDGTVFRKPIIVKGIEPFVKSWKKPITIARHAYGDIYKDVEMLVEEKGVAKLVFENEKGKVTEEIIHNFKDKGMLMAMHNIDSSVESFARSCFGYALEAGEDLWFSAKDTISKKYDHHFKDIFNEIYEKEYKVKFAEKNIEFFYTLIDDIVARIIRSEGGLIWACKNYDGDVMSDMVASAFGSLAMMTSVLVSPQGYYEYEAAHGTVTKHYYRHREGKATSTNSMATIFAWTGALKKRGQLDDNKELIDFTDNLEKASIETIEAGYMTKDLESMSTLENKVVVDTFEFLQKINKVYRDKYL